MIENTVQTLIDDVKEMSGQNSASDARIVRSLNFAADSYSRIAITASGRWRFDSANHGDLSRVTATLSPSESKLPLESELIAIRKVEMYVNGEWKVLLPIDERDRKTQSLETEYGTASETMYYDVDANHLRFYPQSNVSCTIRVTYLRGHPRFSVDNLTQSTGVIPIDDEYLALYAAKRIMIGTNDPSYTAIRNELAEMKEDIKDMYSKRDQDSPRRLTTKIPGAFLRSGRHNR